MASSYLPASALAKLVSEQQIQQRLADETKFDAATKAYHDYTTSPALSYEAINSQFKNRYGSLGNIFGGSFDYDLPRFLVESSYGNVNPDSPYARGFDALAGVDPSYVSNYINKTPYLSNLESVMSLAGKNDIWNESQTYNPETGGYDTSRSLNPSYSSLLNSQGLPNGMSPYSGNFATINSSAAANMADVPNSLEATLNMPQVNGANTDMRFVADKWDDYYAMAPGGTGTPRSTSPYNYDPSNNLIRPDGGYMLEGMTPPSSLNTSGASDRAGSWADQLVTGALTMGVPAALAYGANAVIPGIGGSLANMFMGASQGNTPGLASLASTALGAYNSFDSGIFDRIDPGIPGIENAYGATSYPVTDYGAGIQKVGEEFPSLMNLSTMGDIAQGAGLLSNMGDRFTFDNFNASNPSSLMNWEQAGIDPANVLLSGMGTGEDFTDSYDLLNKYGTKIYDSFGGVSGWDMPNLGDKYSSLHFDNDIGRLFDATAYEQGGGGLKNLYDSSFTDTSLPREMQNTGLGLMNMPNPGGMMPSMEAGYDITQSAPTLSGYNLNNGLSTETAVNPATVDLSNSGPDKGIVNPGAGTNMNDMNAVSFTGTQPTGSFDTSTTGDTNMFEQRGNNSLYGQMMNQSVPQQNVPGNWGGFQAPQEDPSMMRQAADMYGDNKWWMNPAAKGLAGLYSQQKEYDTLSRGVDSLKPMVEQNARTRAGLEADRAGIMANYNKAGMETEKYQGLLGKTYDPSFDPRSISGNLGVYNSMKNEMARKAASKGYRGNDTPLNSELLRQSSLMTDKHRGTLNDIISKNQSSQAQLGGLGRDYATAIGGLGAQDASMQNSMNQMRMQREAALPRMATNWASSTFGDPMKDAAMKYGMDGLQKLFGNG